MPPLGSRILIALLIKLKHVALSITKKLFHAQPPPLPSHPRELSHRRFYEQSPLVRHHLLGVSDDTLSFCDGSTRRRISRTEPHLRDTVRVFYRPSSQKTRHDDIIVRITLLLQHSIRDDPHTPGVNLDEYVESVALDFYHRVTPLSSREQYPCHRTLDPRDDTHPRVRARQVQWTGRDSTGTRIYGGVGFFMSAHRTTRDDLGTRHRHHTHSHRHTALESPLIPD